MGQAPCTSLRCAGECCWDAQDGRNVRPEHQLLAAIVNGEVDKAETMLRTGPQQIVNCRLKVPLSDGTYMCFTDGATPLHLACLLGHQQLAQSLVEKKGDVNAEDERGLTPMS